MVFTKPTQVVTNQNYIIINKKIEEKKKGQKPKSHHLDLI